MWNIVEKSEAHQVLLEPSGPMNCHDNNDLWVDWNYLLKRPETPGIQSQNKTFVLCRACIHESSFEC